ncbi:MULTISPECIES: ATP-binding cassette domain-containing protein [unclassified Microcoleus]|uniref:ATP-binding cassette domain-containing protein n=1 Tax=unclassified Microcoleus TaxID=2642155 RepID=UPI001D9567D2|nr:MULTISPECIES: ATP-binding cassette domain-containing protein [unclassified Microcoleus]MCC3441801.1 ATP-binding cassette domain-containing protein [Microcoleus sp. PH2017_03_ELD_O_A]MCC3464850.1 ATP-binding cassette domain-containing protein [Microcoleus sp. PH2017_06_SFM_O_A]MCC3502900.1 ATP-binding cassette domain-containing protein [Microcoleus sp. PH2017_19_SFW_U_A]TAE15612.1 MAG: ATP-binding cassette domain-containing protein [Oscillatoriales cyanobacterium]MCC3446183.1 ATP-binding cas
MAQVVLENIYKSFPLRQGEQEKVANNVAESVSTETPSSSSNTVLRRINLTVLDGEFMVLVGPSGCGKSTLLRSIAGLEVLTAGNIWIGDRLVNDLPPKDRDIAMVFQNYALYPHLTVYDNLAFGLRRSQKEEGRGKKEEGRGKREEGRGKREEGRRNEEAETVTVTEKGRREKVELIRNKIEEAIDYLASNTVSKERIYTLGEDFLVGATRKLPPGLRYLSEREKAVGERVRAVAQLLQIEPLLNRLPKQLSGGQKQRVALGRAMARNPQVFLMDEPLSNLDAKLRAETRSQIVQLQRQLGTTTIYVTHDQTEAMTMGDRIAIMNAGQLQQVAKPLELYNKPANLFVAEFIGSPPMNFLPVQFTAPLLISHPQFRFTLPDIWAKNLQKYDGRGLILGIRPEHLSINPPATKNLSVQVEIVEALGHETYLRVCLTDDPAVRMQVRVPPERSIRVGEELWLAIAHDKIHLFDPDTELAIFPR